MEFVRASGQEEEYDWLCNAAHPTVLSHFYWFMAGSMAEGQSSETFERFANTEVERLIELVKLLAEQLNRNLNALLEFSEPLLVDVV